MVTTDLQTKMYIESVRISDFLMYLVYQITAID